MKITQTGRLRVARIVRLLASDVREERDAAMLALTRALAAEGLTVADLAAEIEQPVPVQPERPQRGPGRERADFGPGTWTAQQRTDSLPYMRQALASTRLRGKAREFVEKMIYQFEERPHRQTSRMQEAWLAQLLMQASKPPLDLGEE